MGLKYANHIPLSKSMKGELPDFQEYQLKHAEKGHKYFHLSLHPLRRKINHKGWLSVHQWKLLSIVHYNLQYLSFKGYKFCPNSWKKDYSLRQSKICCLIAHSMSQLWQVHMYIFARYSLIFAEMHLRFILKYRMHQDQS